MAKMTARGKVKLRKPKKAKKVSAVTVSTRPGRAIGSGLSKRVGTGTAGKAGRTIGAVKKTKKRKPKLSRWG